MSYQLYSNSSYIIRLSDGVMIPTNPNNADYQQYLLWVSAGNTPAPADAVNPNQDQIDSIKIQLAALDQYLPRGVEDLITSLNVDITTLPTAQQSRLTQKQNLRTQLAGLGS